MGQLLFELFHGNFLTDCRRFFRFRGGGGALPRFGALPIVAQQLVHTHLAVERRFTLGGLHLLVVTVSFHDPGVDVIPQLQLKDIGEFLHQNRVLHPDAHLHAALGIAGEEVAGGNVDTGVGAIKEAVNTAMLQIPSHQTADVQILGLAGHLCAHAADTAYDHINAHPGAAGFLQFQDDVPVADGVVFQDHGSRATHAGGSDNVIHLVQQHALEAQRGNQHLVAFLSELLHSQIAEHLGGFLADALVCGDEGIIGIQLAGFFVVVAGADLGDVGVALCALAGDEGQLGVHLIVLKAVDDGAACAFQLLGPVDVVLLVKAGAQFHQRHHFLAVFGGFHQCLHDLRLPRHAVEGHLDGDDVRVLCGLFEHGDKGTDGLVRVAEQHIMLLHLGGQIIIRRRQHGACRGVEERRVTLGLHAAGELEEEAKVQRALLQKYPLAGQLQTAAQQPLHLRCRGGGDLQTDSRQLAAAPEQLGHDLTIVDIVIHHALFYVDIRVAGDPEQAFFLYGILAEDAGRIVQHQFLGEGKLHSTIFFDEVHPLHLAGDGHNAKALLLRVLFLEQHAKVDLLVAQKRERVAVIHDLRAEDGEQLGLEVFFPEMLLLLGQVIVIYLMVTILCQIFQRLCVEFIALLLQLRRFGHNGGQLLGGGHVGLVFPLFLFGLALLKVCALLQRAHAHHEKLVQIGAVNCQKLDPLAQRDVLVLAQCQNAAVEIQPAQFAVDKDRFVTHNNKSPYFLFDQGRKRAALFSADIRLPCP